MSVQHDLSHGTHWRRSVRLLRPFFVRNWTALGGATAATLLATAATLAQPWPLALVIDELIGTHDGAFTLTGADTTFLALVAGLVLAIALVMAASEYFTDLWLTRAAERIVHDLRVALYGHLQRLSLAFHNSQQKGDLVTRVTGDVNAVGTLFSESLGEIVAAVLLLLGMAAVTFVLDPLLALATFAVVPVLLAVTLYYGRRVALARRQRKEEGQIASLAAETLAAMPVVKAFGSEEYESERVASRSAYRKDLGVEAAKAEARFSGLIEIIGAVARALVLVLGVIRVAAGPSAPATWSCSSPTRTRRTGRCATSPASRRRSPGPWRARIAWPTSSRRITCSRSARARSATGAPPGRGARARVLPLRGRPPGPHRPLAAGAGGVAPCARGAVRSRQVDGRSARRAAVRPRCRQRADRRARCARVVARLAARPGRIPAAGDHAVRGQRRGQHRVRRQRRTRAAIVDAATTAGAHEFIARLPDGYETKLGPAGIGLSGGQRQRIGIARVLLRDPAILILDEPTTGLDAASEDELMGGLERLMSGRTTLLITHSTGLARRAERVVVVADGRVVEDGPPERLLAELRVFRDMAERQGVPGAGAGCGSVAGLVSSRRRLPPADASLPALHRLLVPEAAAGVLGRSLHPGVAPEDVRLVYAQFKRGRRLIAGYAATIDGVRRDAVAILDTKVDLAARRGCPSTSRGHGWWRTTGARAPALRTGRRGSGPVAAVRPRAPGALAAPSSWAACSPSTASRCPTRRCEPSVSTTCPCAARWFGSAPTCSSPTARTASSPRRRWGCARSRDCGPPPPPRSRRCFRTSGSRCRVPSPASSRRTR